jgi:hypothetical protein
VSRHGNALSSLSGTRTAVSEKLPNALIDAALALVFHSDQAEAHLPPPRPPSVPPLTRRLKTRRFPGEKSSIKVAEFGRAFC